MVNKVDGNNYYAYTKQKKIDVPDSSEKFNLDYQKNETPSDSKDKKGISGQEKQHTVEQGGVRLDLSTGGQAADANRRKQAEAAKTQSESVSGQKSLLDTIRAYIIAAVTAVREFFYNIWNEKPQEDAPQDSLMTEEIRQDVQSSENVSGSAELAESVPGNVELAESVSGSAELAESVPGNVELAESVSGSTELTEDVSRDVRRMEIDPQDVMQAESSLWEAMYGGSGNSAEIIDASDEISALALEEERRNREIRQSLRDGDMEHVISLLTENGRRTVAKNSTLLTVYDKNGRVTEPSASDRERVLHGDRNTWKYMERCDGG